LIRQHGSKNKKKFEILGRNARLDELQAQLLIYKLKNFNKNQKHKLKLFKLYIEKLNFCKKISLPYDDKKNLPSMSLFTIRTNYRDELVNYLTKKKISIALYYPYTLNSVKYFRNNFKFKNSLKASKMNLSLPISDMHTINEIKFVCRNINNYFLKIK
jgi:dTDP-4-amino-4,6-dideoxygalactose transaminase